MLKNIMKYCLRESIKKEKLKVGTIGFTVGALIGVSAGVLMADKEKRQKIKDSSMKIAQKAGELADEAKKIIIKTHDGCCKEKRIVEVYPDD